MSDFNKAKQNFTDEEIITAMECCSFGEHCEKCPFWDVEEDNRSCSDILYEKELEMIKRLQSENAALRERLDKAVELPVKIGDKVYQVYDKCDGRNCPYNGYYGQWRCSYEGKQRCKPFIDVKSFCYDDIPRINKTVFVSEEAAEKRLAELGGEK